MRQKVLDKRTTTGILFGLAIAVSLTGCAGGKSAWVRRSMAEPSAGPLAASAMAGPAPPSRVNTSEQRPAVSQVAFQTSPAPWAWLPSHGRFEQPALQSRLLVTLMTFSTSCMCITPTDRTQVTACSRGNPRQRIASKRDKKSVY